MSYTFACAALSALWLVTGLSGCTKAPSPEAREAVIALKRLQAKVEAGISYRDYRVSLGDTLGSVKLFIEDKSASDFPQLQGAVAASMQEYRRAGEVWETKISRISMGEYKEKYIPIADARKKDLLVGLDEQSGYELVDGQPLVFKAGGDTVVLDDLLQIRWHRAGKHLLEASKLLDNPGA